MIVFKNRRFLCVERRFFYAFCTVNVLDRHKTTVKSGRVSLDFPIRQIANPFIVLMHDVSLHMQF